MDLARLSARVALLRPVALADLEEPQLGAPAAIVLEVREQRGHDRAPHAVEPRDLRVDAPSRGARWSMPSARRAPSQERVRLRLEEARAAASRS